MSWVNVFGGQPQSPSDVSGRTFSFSADFQLSWPWQNNDTDDIAAKIMNVTPTAGGLTIMLPPANVASNGEALIFRNMGGFAFDVINAASGAVVTVNPSISQFVYIADNTSAGGTWLTLTFGAGASNVDAAALAGMGLKAISSLLNQDFFVKELVTSYPVALSDRASLLSVQAGIGVGTLPLPPIVTATNGFFFAFANNGNGAWTIDPDAGELIDNASTLIVNPGEAMFVAAGPSGWYTVGRGRSTIFVQSRLNKNVAGGSNVVLTPTEAQNIIQTYFGLLTANIAVIVPTAVQIYFVENTTTGSFDLVVKTAAGTGVTIPQGQRVIVHCDGTNVVDSDTVAPNSSLSMASGTVGAPGLAFTADPDTGFYRPNSNELGIVAGAQEIARFSQNGVDVMEGELKIAGTDVVALIMAIG